jgi:hypothetical protein
MSDSQLDAVTAGQLVTTVIELKVGQAPQEVWVGAPNAIPDHQTKFDSLDDQVPHAPGAVR